MTEERPDGIRRRRPPHRQRNPLDPPIRQNEIPKSLSAAHGQVNHLFLLAAAQDGAN